MAKGREDAHIRSKVKEKSKVPIIGIDYKVFGQEIETDDKATALIMRDRDSVSTFGHVCEHKGASDKWAMDRIIDDIDSLGYTEIILRGDGEPALVQVMNEVKRRRHHSTILQNPPAYDPQSNGVAEKAVQEFMEQVVHAWEPEPEPGSQSQCSPS